MLVNKAMPKKKTQEWNSGEMFADMCEKCGEILAKMVLIFVLQFPGIVAVLMCFLFASPLGFVRHVEQCYRIREQERFSLSRMRWHVRAYLDDLHLKPFWQRD